MIGSFLKLLGRRADFDVDHVIGNLAINPQGPVIQNFYSGDSPDVPFLPWCELPSQLNVFQYLSWECKLVPFTGRETELTNLRNWATQPSPRCNVRFLTGPGGAGKSRIAAELCTQLRSANWTAGFIPLEKPGIFPVTLAGLLMVVDYPEEKRAQTRSMLTALARLEEPPAPIRVLLLSRRDAAWWQTDIDSAHAAAICDTQQVQVAQVSEADTLTIFQQAVARVTQHLSLPQPEIDVQSVCAWRAQQPELHALPLFITAAAIQCALESTGTPALSAGEVVRALVRREQLRLNNTGAAAGFGEFGAMRLAALSAVPGQLDTAGLHRLADPILELSAPPPASIINAVRSLPWWNGNTLPALTPDIVAATLLLETLSQRSDQASEWLWTVIEGCSSDWVSRVERLAHDIRTVYGPAEKRFEEYLTGIAGGSAGRAQALESITRQQSPRATLPLAVEVGKLLIAQPPADHSERATLLLNVSTLFGMAGDDMAAVQMAQKAVDIYRALAGEDPQSFEPRLATGLNNLSNRLSASGDRRGALKAIQQAAEIRRKYATSDRASRRALADVLNNLSAHLSGLGADAQAIAINEEALLAYRQLKEQSEDGADAALANSLRNYAQLLPAARLETASQAAQDAVNIYENLAVENPARFEPDLAASLRILSNKLSEGKNSALALNAAQRAVRISERLKAENSDRFGHVLATAYETLAFRLSEAGDQRAAVDKIEIATQIWQDLAAGNSEAFAPDLARVLDHFADMLRRDGRTDEAAAKNGQAVDIWRGLAERYPERFKPDLARNLNNFSILIRERDPRNALKASVDAVGILIPLAQERPELRYDLGLALGNLHDLLIENENLPFALLAILQAADIFRELAKQDPARCEPALLSTLFHLHVLLEATDDPRAAAVSEELVELGRRMRP